MHPEHAEYRLRFTVPPDQAGRTLLDFLSARFPLFSAGDWIARIERRRLLVDNAPAEPGRVLAIGHRIEYLDADIPEPDVDTRYTVPYRDDQVLVVDKPAGLPCHPGGRYRYKSLTMLVCRDLGLDNVVLVNRLDRETSGLVILAIDRRAGALLQRQFVARTVEKRYKVLVEGEFPEYRRATGHIAPDTASVVRKRRVFIPAGEGDADGLPAGAAAAATVFRRLSAGGGISRLSAHPETGRQHQIRATLSALGHPVVGDKLYGVDPTIFLRFCNGAVTAEDRRRLRIDRQALHASGIRFTHPVSRCPVDVESPLPPDLQALIRGHGGATIPSGEGVKGQAIGERC